MDPVVKNDDMDLVHAADTTGADTKKDATRGGTVPLQPSQQNTEELTRTLKGWWQKDGPHAKKWREGDQFTIGCTEAFDFVAMRQWSEDEVAYLQSQRRVPITFNRTLPTIAAVKGIEVNSRHDVQYLPRTSDVLNERGQMVVKANENLSAASQSFADEADAEDEQSEAFGDALTCGMGFSETRVDYDEDPQGSYKENTLDPREMAWDFRVRKKNLADAQRLWHLRCMPLHEAQSMFPEIPINDLDCSWAMTDVDVGRQRVDDEGFPRDEEMDSRDRDPQTDIHILRVQWWEHEQVMIVAHPASPDQPQIMTPDQYTLFSKVFEGAKQAATASGQKFPANYTVQAKKGKRKRYYEAYIGRSVLEPPKPPQYGAAPGAEDAGFTINCITGLQDKTRGYWFGLVAVMRDPQKWANTWLSQTMHIVNTTAKGGILAEETAFVDPKKAEDEYGRPESIIFLRDGAISGGKVMQKPGIGITAGHANLLQFAIQSIRDVVGVNLETLGLADRNQPGVLEAQRKQAAMTILAPWFDSLRRYRKQIGRVRLYYIQNYLATPNRMIRIAGEDGMTLVPLLKQHVIGKHDTVIADSPTSPNQKEATWALMQPLLPLLGDKLKESPELLAIILKFSPIPTQASEAIMAALQKPPSPEQQQQQAIGIAGAKSQLNLNDAKANQANAAATAATAAAAFSLAEAASQKQQADLASRAEMFGREVETFLRGFKAPPLMTGDEPDLLSPGAGMPGHIPMPPQLPQPPMQGGLPNGAIPQAPPQIA